MSISAQLIGELTHESNSTKRILERVPTDKLSWRAHEKSMTLGRLATHVAEIPVWITRILTADEFDFATAKFNLQGNSTTEEIVQECEERTATAIQSLESVSDDEYAKIWTVKRGDQIVYQLPKGVAVRSWGFNHLFHHRGQLSVYLRLLDIPVPGMYGPSADER